MHKTKPIDQIKDKRSHFELLEAMQNHNTQANKKFDMNHINYYYQKLSFIFPPPFAVADKLLEELKKAVDFFAKSQKTDPFLQSQALIKYAERCYEFTKAIEKARVVTAWKEFGKYQAWVKDVNIFIDKAFKSFPLSFRAQQLRVRRAIDKVGKDPNKINAYTRTLTKALALFSEYLEKEENLNASAIIRFVSWLIECASFSKEQNITEGETSPQKIANIILKIKLHTLKYSDSEYYAEIEENRIRELMDEARPFSSN